MKKIIFGLIGKNISYSFSRNYFANKFKELKIEHCEYRNFDISNINKFIETTTTQNVKGFNVTVPYKEAIIPFLDKINKKAKAIGAINTIRITKKRKLKGYNTDEYGFRKSLEPLLEKHHKKALILGTGGASKAIAYSLSKLNISYKFVSRKKMESNFTYSELNKSIIEAHSLIINCTPLGTFPNIVESPELPYKYITKKHLLYDLVYNPEVSMFLKLGQQKGAKIKNGYEMLVLQAEKAWEIWNK